MESWRGEGREREGGGGCLGNSNESNTRIRAEE